MAVGLLAKALFHHLPVGFVTPFFRQALEGRRAGHLHEKRQLSAQFQNGSAEALERYSGFSGRRGDQFPSLRFQQGAQPHLCEDVEKRRCGDLAGVAQALQFATGGGDEGHGIGIGQGAQKTEELGSEDVVAGDGLKLVEEADEPQVGILENGDGALEAREIFRLIQFQAVSRRH